MVLHIRTHTRRLPSNRPLTSNHLVPIGQAVATSGIDLCELTAQTAATKRCECLSWKVPEAFTEDLRRSLDLLRKQAGEAQQQAGLGQRMLVVGNNRVQPQATLSRQLDQAVETRLIEAGSPHPAVTLPDGPCGR